MPSRSDLPSINEALHNSTGPLYQVPSSSAKELLAILSSVTMVSGQVNRFCTRADKVPGQFCKAELTLEYIKFKC